MSSSFQTGFKLLFITVVLAVYQQQKQLTLSISIRIRLLFSLLSPIHLLCWSMFKSDFEIIEVVFFMFKITPKRVYNY